MLCLPRCCASGRSCALARSQVPSSAKRADCALPLPHMLLCSARPAGLGALHHGHRPHRGRAAGLRARCPPSPPGWHWPGRGPVGGGERVGEIARALGAKSQAASPGLCSWRLSAGRAHRARGALLLASSGTEGTGSCPHLCCTALLQASQQLRDVCHAFLLSQLPPETHAAAAAAAGRALAVGEGSEEGADGMEVDEGAAGCGSSLQERSTFPFARFPCFPSAQARLCYTSGWVAQLTRAPPLCALDRRRHIY